MKFQIILFLCILVTLNSSPIDNRLYNNSSDYEIIQLKFEWNHTDKCDLVSLFKNNNLSDSCLEVKDKIEINTEFLFITANNSDDFSYLNLFLNLDMIVEIRSSIDDPDRNIFLEWNPQNNSFYFIGTGFNQNSSEFDFSNLTIFQSFPSIFIKILDDTERNGIFLSENIQIKYSNGLIIVENFDYKFEDVFLRIYNYTEILVDIKLENFSVNIDDWINYLNESVCVSLYGYLDIFDFVNSDEIIHIELSKIFIKFI